MPFYQIYLFVLITLILIHFYNTCRQTILNALAFIALVFVVSINFMLHLAIEFFPGFFMLIYSAVEVLVTLFLAPIFAQLAKSKKKIHQFCECLTLLMCSSAVVRYLFDFGGAWKKIFLGGVAKARDYPDIDVVKRQEWRPYDTINPNVESFLRRDILAILSILSNYLQIDPLSAQLGGFGLTSFSYCTLVMCMIGMFFILKKYDGVGSAAELTQKLENDEEAVQLYDTSFTIIVFMLQMPLWVFLAGAALHIIPHVYDPYYYAQEYYAYIVLAMRVFEHASTCIVVSLSRRGFYCSVFCIAFAILVGCLLHGCSTSPRTWWENMRLFMPPLISILTPMLTTHLLLYVPLILIKAWLTGVI